MQTLHQGYIITVSEDHIKEWVGDICNNISSDSLNGLIFPKGKNDLPSTNPFANSLDTILQCIYDTSNPDICKFHRLAAQFHVIAFHFWCQRLQIIICISDQLAISWRDPFLLLNNLPLLLIE